MASVHLHSLIPKLFLAHRVWSPHCPNPFSFLRFKICDTISNALCDVTWNYDRAVKIKLVARIIFLGASECQETKINKTWNHYQTQRDPKTILLDKYKELHTTHSQKFWYSFASPFSGSAWLCLLYSASTALLFWLWLHSTWYQLHEKTWLECHHSDACNENRITRLTFVPSCSACWQERLPSLSSQYLALHGTASPSQHHTWWCHPAPCAFGTVWMLQSYWLCSESVASGHCLESPAQERERSRESIDQLESYLHQYAGIIISDKNANSRIFCFIMWREIFCGLSWL